MNWEPWTGCYKVSDGCTYCYFYEPYSKRHGQNTVQKADEWRAEAWHMIKQRPDLDFLILTKRIDRFPRHILAASTISPLMARNAEKPTDRRRKMEAGK